MENEEATNSSSKKVIKSSKSVDECYDESTNVKQMKASEVMKKYSHKHSSSRSSKFFSQISDQQLTAQKQSVFNKSIDNWMIQSQRSTDSERVTESTNYFSDQHSNSVE